MLKEVELSFFDKITHCLKKLHCKLTGKKNLFLPVPKNLKPQEKSLYPTNSILDTYPDIAVTHSNTVLAVIKLEHLSTSTRVFQGPKKMQENEAECIHS